LEVPDEGYSRNVSRALNLISTFLLLFKYISRNMRISSPCELPDLHGYVFSNKNY
jgi:hypothetical protein